MASNGDRQQRSATAQQQRPGGLKALFPEFDTTNIGNIL
jgi:hypothetical protein